MLQLRQGEQRLSHHLVRQQAMTLADGGRERPGRDLCLTAMKQGVLDGAAQLPRLPGQG
jgi:hypothetical protein